jgi:hypothetical protein
MTGVGRCGVVGAWQHVAQLMTVVALRRHYAGNGQRRLLAPLSKEVPCYAACPPMLRAANDFDSQLTLVKPSPAPPDRAETLRSLQRSTPTN